MGISQEFFRIFEIISQPRRGYEKVLEIKKRNFQKKACLICQNFQGNLSGVLKDMGDYRKAKECYFKALEIYKKHFGENHLKYATFFGELVAS